jgi:NAD+ synthetase
MYRYIEGVIRLLDPDLEHLFPGAPAVPASDALQYSVSETMLNGRVQEDLTRQLQAHLADRIVLGYESLVVGLSGGVDSAVCARLVQDAAPGASHGVIVNLGDAVEEVRIAQQVAVEVGIPVTVLDGRPVFRAHLAVMPERRMISRIHARSRLITSVLFQFADNCGGLVVDTTDRSERILCLYEEGQRGHVAPVANLYKSELYAMAASMGIGELTASGCPDLDNLDAFGLAWSQLDGVLDLLTSGAAVEALASTYGLDEAWLWKLAWRLQMQPLRTNYARLGVMRGP